MTTDAMRDLALVERQITKLVKHHGAAAVKRAFAKLPIHNWPAWQRVNTIVSRSAKKARPR